MGITLSGAEAQIAQNLPSLEGYLGQRQYSQALVPVNADNTIARYDPQTMGAVPGGYVPYAGQGVGAAGMVPAQNRPPVVQGVPPEQFAQLQQYALQLEQANQIAAQQAIAAEEQAFLYAIADLPEEEKVIAWQQRQIDQLAQANGHLSHRVQSAEEAADEEEQEFYKDVVAAELCRRNGINYANPQVEAAFMAANSKPEMDNLVALLTANRPQWAGGTPGVAQPQPMSPAQLGAGLVAAQGMGQGGGRAVAIRSGDLGSYLKAKGGYQVAYTE